MSDSVCDGPSDPLSGRPKDPAEGTAASLLADELPTQLEATSAAVREPTAPASQGRFGDYELNSEIARGGMGVVYRATQVKLKRTVALKMILAGKLATADDVQRFIMEAEAAGRLSHPNIVAIYEVGELQGQHFFSMEFIKGMSLAQRLQQGPLPGRVAARYVRQIARAVQYAHKQGILHRDLKPSNIMLDDEHDEPHITDFGLAKHLGNQDSKQTRTGAVIGTPSYMAPEQAQGRTRELGPACDIYSLGAILYDVLTGRPPHRAETALDTVMQVIHNEPVPVTLLNPKVDKDLETICHKCLEKDPLLRYASAEALAMDLQNYLDGNSINARSSNVLDRLTRMLDRSQHDANFATWSTMILLMGAVVGIQHTLIFLLMHWNAPRWSILSARTIEFILLICLFWHNRRNTQLLPTTSAERELWTIWIGYFFAMAATVVVTRVVRALDFIDPAPHAPPHFEEMLPYPFMSIITGLCFFVMGSNYWGRCYALGVVFFVLGAVMTFFLEWAPLVFGLAWAAALTGVGWHLRGFARQHASP